MRQVTLFFATVYALYICALVSCRSTDRLFHHSYLLSDSTTSSYSEDSYDNNDNDSHSFNNVKDIGNDYFDVEHTYINIERHHTNILSLASDTDGDEKSYHFMRHSNHLNMLPLPINDLQYHGTTTISFKYKNGIIIAVDSRASIGNYVGSRTVKKIFPITTHAVATMAGGAADCSYWIRHLSKQIKASEYRHGSKLSIKSIAKMLSSTLRDYKGSGLSVGTMIAGYDTTSELYYVDSEGSCVGGDLFCVGSGSQLAYSIMDSHDKKLTSIDNIDEAVELATWAIRHAAHRDGFSGGYINIIHVDATGIRHIKRIDSRILKLK